MYKVKTTQGATLSISFKKAYKIDGVLQKSLVIPGTGEWKEIPDDVLGEPYVISYRSKGLIMVMPVDNKIKRSQTQNPKHRGDRRPAEKSETKTEKDGGV